MATETGVSEIGIFASSTCNFNIVTLNRMTIRSFETSFTFDNESDLARLPIGRTTQNDVYLLPKKLDEKVARFHIPHSVQSSPTATTSSRVKISKLHR